MTGATGEGMDVTMEAEEKQGLRAGRTELIGMAEVEDALMTYLRKASK